MTKSISDILQQFRDEARSNRDLGDRFERLMVGFLKKDPIYSDLFSAVWLWGEWPERGNKPDVGIDIVAQERGSGDVWAIQCKFFDPAHTLQKADIDSFFTASGKAPFKKRLIISTTDNWSRHAEDACKNQQIPVSRLRVQDLDESSGGLGGGAAGSTNGNKIQGQKTPSPPSKRSPRQSHRRVKSG
jgi:predicted helicase